MTGAIPSNLAAKLDELDRQFEDLTAQLASPDVASDHRAARTIAIKRAAIEPIVSDYRALRSAQVEFEEMREHLRADDAELADFARAELPDLEARCECLLASLQRQLVHADDQAVGSIILELRAGVGGDEAAIWAGDLLEMYQRFASSRGWRVEPMHAAPSEPGGFKHAIIAITGEGVWAQLGYEGGTHQVKRVPATEAQGRVHTSTATVAVLPEPEEIEVELDPNDVKEMITTSQGPGGQNVNKVATAVHLIHQPTGIDVRIQDTKSQAQNRAKAWQLLRARLYERQQAERDAERAEARNSMIGSGLRAEKIRTYRYKENIVVDHRVGRSFNLGEVMAGNLSSVIEALIERETEQRLAAL